MDKVSSFFSGLTGSASIQVKINQIEGRKRHKMRGSKGQKIKLPVFTGNQDLTGQIKIQLKDTKKYEHLGVKVMLIGYLQIYSDKNLSTQFHSLSKELQPAGFLTQNKNFNFKFPSFQKQYQTFNGIAGRVRYFVRVVINRSNIKSVVVKQVDFAVLQFNSNIQQTQVPTPVKMQVGIQECLHIQFQFAKSFYHLKDSIIGRVNFQLVKIKIQSMQIHLIRKQTFGTGSQNKTQTQTLVKYQVMDGCPQKGQVIPIRMYMNGVQLAPSYKNIHNRLNWMKNKENILSKHKLSYIENQIDIQIKKHQNFLFNGLNIIFIMQSSSHTRIQAVQKCQRVDKRILTFIKKNRNQSAFPQFTKHFFAQHKTKLKSKSIYKTSLADWRKLYNDKQRPQTQSLVQKWIINKHRTAQIIKGQHKSANKNQYHKSHYLNQYKTGFYYSPQKQINNLKKQNLAKNIITKSILNNQNPQYSKTTMNFYSSPLKKQIQFVGNLTARLTHKNSNNSNKAFRTKRPKAFSNYLN